MTDQAAAPLIGDSSDRTIELSKAKRIQGWTVEEWVAFVRRHPDATLPGGVGGAIVESYTVALAEVTAGCTKFIQTMAHVIVCDNPDRCAVCRAEAAMRGKLLS